MERCKRIIVCSVVRPFQVLRLCGEEWYMTANGKNGYGTGISLPITRQYSGSCLHKTEENRAQME